MAQRLLLLEGQDDFHVVMALLHAHSIPKAFEIPKPSWDGVEDLLEEIPVRLKVTEGLERLAVILDADEDIQARWQQLRHRLTQAGCENVPSEPTPDGAILRIPGGPTVGVWLMPDNQLPGMLESFLGFLVPPGDALLPLVDGFLAGIPDNLRRYPMTRHPKARIHTWLALQNEPGKPLGQSITARYLDPASQTAAPFLSWLRRALVD